MSYINKKLIIKHQKEHLNRIGLISQTTRAGKNKQFTEGGNALALLKALPDTFEAIFSL